MAAETIWLVPLLPLLGAAVMLLIGRKLGERAIAFICSATVFGSLAWSIMAAIDLARSQRRGIEVILGTWVAGFPAKTVTGGAPPFSADWGFLLDPLSAVMILVVTGVSLLIHVYSAAYMHGDDGYFRYFGYLNLFVFFMLLLVLANNYALTFAGWEGVGLASYLLIGYWYERKAARDGATKAFLVNRVGDAGYVLGMMTVFAMAGTLRYTEIDQTVGPRDAPLAMAAVLLFGFAAAGKSAQFPLFTWLPDAMAGPTPVSALIHAATMVTAGVYLLVRSNALLAVSGNVPMAIAIVGAFTALFAGSIALVETDIKRVLAWSTVSQLGLMFVAIGCGAYWVAVFHLFTHAFFKALLFLGAGSIIHCLNGEQDLRMMGGLKQKMPITFWTMAVASLAIAGVPGFAGFFSKDEILGAAWGGGGTILFGCGLVVSLMTAFYMCRLMMLAFFAPAHPKTENAHESPTLMWLPLILLAIPSAIAGWFHRSFEHWLRPVFDTSVASMPPPQPVSLSTVMVLSTTVAFAGIFWAARRYRREDEGPLAKFLAAEWHIDALYHRIFVRGFAVGGGDRLATFDRRIIDGGVDGTGFLTRLASRVSIFFDRWIIDGLVRGLALLTRAASYPVREWQSGFVQSYAFTILAGAAALLGYLLLR